MSLLFEERKCPLCGYEYAIHDDSSNMITCIGCGVQFMDNQKLKSDILILYINQELTDPIKEILSEEFTKKNILDITKLELGVIGGMLTSIYITCAIFGADKSMFTPEFIKLLMRPMADELSATQMINCNGMLDKYIDDVIDIFRNVIIPSERLQKVIRDKHLDIIASRYAELNEK